MLLPPLQLPSFLVLLRLLDVDVLLLLIQLGPERQLENLPAGLGQQIRPCLTQSNLLPSLAGSVSALVRKWYKVLILVFPWRVVFGGLPMGSCDKY